ncbi:hypothetical protein BJX70DRAFT_381176 [Aspergillus crustosus]
MSETWGPCIQTLNNDSQVKSLSWSKDGRIASGSDDHNVILSILVTGRTACTGVK